MPFLSELYTYYAPGRNRWRLAAPLIYQTHDGETITVPTGFITDLASIPWLARVIVPHNYSERLAAVVHDYLFTIQDRSMLEANRVMREAMQDAGVGWYVRAAISSGLALGSWVVWRKHARALKRDRASFLAQYGLDESNL